MSGVQCKLKKLLKTVDKFKRMNKSIRISFFVITPIEYKSGG